jgi:hypothetical protein
MYVHVHAHVHVYKYTHTHMYNIYITTIHTHIRISATHILIPMDRSCQIVTVMRMTEGDSRLNIYVCRCEMSWSWTQLCHFYHYGSIRVGLFHPGTKAT